MADAAMTRQQQAVGVSSQEETIRQMLTQRTPKEAIRHRKGKGGREFPFVDHVYVTETLNKAFGWDWDFVTENEEILFVGDVPFEIKVRGRLTVRMGERQIVKMQYGSQAIEFLKGSDGKSTGTPVTIGDAFKGAASDALKKCASLLGIALDLYDSDGDLNQKQGSSGGSNRNNAHTQASTQNTEASPTLFWSIQREYNIPKEQAAAIANAHGQDWKTAIAKLKGLIKEAV